MIQLDKKHTANYLKDEVLSCLKTYDIELHQIYSSTTDNGANVIKFGQLLQELQVEQNEVTCLIEENDNVDEIGESVQKSLTAILSVVRCAAHTIQLAAHDVTKTMQTPIADCRKAVKTLRNLIRTSGLRKELPILDNTTRWNSTFEMLKSLLNLRDFIDSQFNDIMSTHSVNWHFVLDFVTSLTRLSKCTQQLQKEQYILEDFYRDWLNCELELEDIATTTASLLHHAMQTRKKLLLKNDAFAAALYLDPRFNFLNSNIITEAQKSQALEHLVKTFNIMLKLENVKDNLQLTENTPNFVNKEPEENMELPTTSHTAYAKLAQHILNSVVNTPQSTEIKQTFREKLFNLSYRKMVSLDTDIIEYFKTNSLDADVLKVVNVALAVPASQVSVKRAFSALALTLTKLRNKLNNTTLNNLLITKLNLNELNSYNVNLDVSNEESTN